MTYTTNGHLSGGGRLWLFDHNPVRHRLGLLREGDADGVASHLFHGERIVSAGKGKQFFVRTSN